MREALVRMRISTGVALILSSGLFVGTANQAFAGSKSVALESSRWGASISYCGKKNKSKETA